MAQTMTLSSILDDLGNVGSDGVEKTASAADAGAVDKTKQELMNALVNVETEKTAAAPANVVDPAAAAPAVDKLVKMATDLAHSENQATVKEAHLLGAAFADGAMTRFNQYEQAAGSTKVASVQEVATTGNPQQDFEKFASANPDITKQAIEVGYHHGKIQIAQMQKQAFDKGRAEASTQIQELSKTVEGQQKLAEISDYVLGNTKTASAEPNDFEKWASTPEGQEAMPMVRAGYEDAATEINKIASDVFDRGYSDTVALLQAV